MNDQQPNISIDSIAKLVAHQLKAESKYLETVIASCTEMQSILRERGKLGRRPVGSENPPSSSEESVSMEDSIAPEEATDSTSLPAELERRSEQRIQDLRTATEANFHPIVGGRKGMIQALVAIDLQAKSTPTLTELASLVQEPRKSELKNLRIEIRSKLNQIHSISMGNQAVLLYTLDFYNRLLAGFSGGTEQSSYYNASGRSENHIPGSIVQTNC